MNLTKHTLESRQFSMTICVMTDFNNSQQLEANMPSKGYRERLKAAKDINDARAIMADVRRNCPERYIKRCQRVFDQLPFTKDAA